MRVAEIYTKDKDGNISKSSVMKGESAYDSAKIGGYSGTEEEFYMQLGQSVTKSELDVKLDDYADKEYVNIMIGGALNGTY